MTVKELRAALFLMEDDDTVMLGDSCYPTKLKSVEAWMYDGLDLYHTKGIEEDPGMIERVVVLYGEL